MMDHYRHLLGQSMSAEPRWNYSGAHIQFTISCGLGKFVRCLKEALRSVAMHRRDMPTSGALRIHGKI